MVIPNVIDQQMKHLNPMYMQGYEEGYTQAKIEMVEFVKKMCPFFTETFTVGITLGEPNE